LNALDLKKDTPAVFIGEPTGGKPNHYGELQALRLPVSGPAVTYSTKYFRVVEGDPESITPDIQIELDFDAHRGKSDPALDAALDWKR